MDEATNSNATNNIDTKAEAEEAVINDTTQHDDDHEDAHSIEFLQNEEEGDLEHNAEQDDDDDDDETAEEDDKDDDVANSEQETTDTAPTAVQEQEAEVDGTELGKLRRERRDLEAHIGQLNIRIDMLDLTLDKFWDEVFDIYDWIAEKERQGVSFAHADLQAAVEFKQHVQFKLIDRYVQLLDYGHPMHLLRASGGGGKWLKMESKAMEMVFDKLTSRNATPTRRGKPPSELFVVTVIGEQSSAKSSLMNALFGCSFRTSAGRCTRGMYMNVVECENGQRLVVLDTEGLMSVEANSDASSPQNSTFDNQMATMAVLSSHLIIINHKGEISSNLARLLGITFYAKLRTSQSTFKPTVMFVLRDQNERSEQAQMSMVSQASALKDRIVKQADFLRQSVDDILHIDTDDLTLLCNAFTERSPNEFADSVLELRKLIVSKLNGMDREGHRFDELASLYSSMCAYWKVCAFFYFA